MSVEIAPMRWWHLPSVHALEESVFPTDAWSPEQFWQELAQPTRRYAVACDADAVVGYAGLMVIGSDADVQTVAVHPERQGRGIAAALLTNLIESAEVTGVTHTMLEVRADNEAARALYERLGFARISERRHYYPDGCDAVIMRRPRPRVREEADRGSH